MGALGQGAPRLSRGVGNLFLEQHLIKSRSHFFLEARGTQGGPGGPRGKPVGPQGALGTPCLAFPWPPLASKKNLAKLVFSLRSLESAKKRYGVKPKPSGFLFSSARFSLAAKVLRCHISCKRTETWGNASGAGCPGELQASLSSSGSGLWFVERLR